MSDDDARRLTMEEKEKELEIRRKQLEKREREIEVEKVKKDKEKAAKKDKKKEKRENLRKLKKKLEEALEGSDDSGTSAERHLLMRNVRLGKIVCVGLMVSKLVVFMYQVRNGLGSQTTVLGGNIRK